jgi:hypothetical protein
MAFNPFGKAIGDLAADDLQVLLDRSVAEGYYVEYKSDFPETVKIARGLASFANTNGGWYFVGVSANKKTNVAEALSGLDLAKYPDPIATVRNAARDYLDPPPLFFPQLVQLATGRWVLVVFVPESEQTPHICSDGRIYRRNADASEPVYEKDRYALDRLVERGKESTRRFERFCKDDRTFSQAEDQQSWFEGYFAPYPPGGVQTLKVFRTTDLEAVLRSSKEPLEVTFAPDFVITIPPEALPTVPFHTQTGFGSVVLRLLDSSRLAFNTLEMEFFSDGRCKMLVPLTFRNVWKPGAVESAHVRDFLAMQRVDSEPDLVLLRFVDLLSTWGLLSWTIALYFKWLKENGWDGDLWTRMRLANVWRCAPFWDVDAWAKHAAKFGVPVSHKNTLEVPQAGQHPITVSPSKEGALATILSLVTLALGVPLGTMWEWAEQHAFANRSAPKDDMG